MSAVIEVVGLAIARGSGGGLSQARIRLYRKEAAGEIKDERGNNSATVRRGQTGRGGSVSL